jgi:SP family general alpha glucoside:H+ symporter-like MFS transporter
LAKLPGGSTKFIPLLLAKINELLPDLIKPLCEAIELPGINIEPLSPDSRFIYEEEVTTSLYANLRRNR